MASMFTARAFCEQAAAAHALESKVLNAPEDLIAGARVQSVAARVQNAAVPDQNAVVPAQTVVAQAQTVAVPAQNAEAVDLTAAGDHDAVAVHDAGAFPHVARAPSGKVVAHNCAQVDPDVARVCLLFHFARDAPHAVARLARHVVQDVPDVRFFPADPSFRSWPDALTALQFPRPAV